MATENYTKSRRMAANLKRAATDSFKVDSANLTMAELS
jgi:hypothetical protein